VEAGHRKEALSRGPTLSFLAPAVSVETFDTLIGDAIVEHGIRVLVAHLTDAAERGDGSCTPYGRSLLYLVSRAFERRVGTPPLGMEKHLVPALVAHEWGGAVTRLPSPGAAYRRGDQLTVATSHQGIDADDAVRDAVVRHIRGRALSGAVVRPLS
jgi:hypothetical protein